MVNETNGIGRQPIKQNVHLGSDDLYAFTQLDFNEVRFDSDLIDLSTKTMT